MADTPGTIVVKDGLAVARNLGTMVDGTSPATQYPQYQPRTEGAPVSAANPLPSTDLTAQGSLATIVTQDTAIAAATGAKSDVAWVGTGDATIVAALKAIWSKTGGGGSVTVSGPLPAGSNLIGAVLPGIGTAIDFSANPPSLAGLNLLSTLAADATRAGGYLVQNQSAVPLTVVLDDGAGAVQTVFLLAPGSGAGTQGASASADWGIHRGRIRIYGAAGSQVAARAW